MMRIRFHNSSSRAQHGRFGELAAQLFSRLGGGHRAVFFEQCPKLELSGDTPRPLGLRVSFSNRGLPAVKR